MYYSIKKYKKMYSDYRKFLYSSCENIGIYCERCDAKKFSHDKDRDCYGGIKRLINNYNLYKKAKTLVEKLNDK